VTSAVWYLAAAKLLFHLLTAARYGIFRDELYYLACAEHLDWGYVDQPPLIAVIAWTARHAFGESLLGLRFLPAVAGAALVLLAGKLAREMGGGRFAQGAAALAVVVAPIYLIMHHWLTMNAFEPLLWMGCSWCVVRVIATGRLQYWLWFGVLAGLGMETKYSMALFVASALAALLLTPQRRQLNTRWFWSGALVAVVIFLPNLVWLIQHDFPFLELMRNVRQSGRDVVRGPVAFVADQAMILNPVTFPLWAGGLAWLLLRGGTFRALGYTYALLLALMIGLKGKNYYLAPAYPMLFAAGGVALERIPRWRRLRPAYAAAIASAGIVFAPLAAPILAPESYLRYQAALGIVPPAAENQPAGPLPQYFADEFGWEEMARETARVYTSLPPDERARTAIFANNYGQAGAIDFFGPKYGLPKAVSGHQNYWYWGPREYSGEIVIVLGSDGRGDRELFHTVEAAGRAAHPYSRRDEQFDMFLCRGLKTKLEELWPSLKKWN
jgi:hypothetical protein